MPFALSHAIGDGLVSLASKVGRFGVSDTHTVTQTLLWSCCIVLSFSLEPEEPVKGCNGVVSGVSMRVEQKVVGEGQERAEADASKAVKPFSLYYHLCLLAP